MKKGVTTPSHSPSDENAFIPPVKGDWTNTLPSPTTVMVRGFWISPGPEPSLDICLMNSPSGEYALTQP